MQKRRRRLENSLFPDTYSAVSTYIEFQCLQLNGAVLTNVLFENSIHSLLT